MKHQFKNKMHNKSNNQHCWSNSISRNAAARTYRIRSAIYIGHRPYSQGGRAAPTSSSLMSSRARNLSPISSQSNRELPLTSSSHFFTILLTSTVGALSAHRGSACELIVELSTTTPEARLDLFWVRGRSWGQSVASDIKMIGNDRSWK